MKLQVVNKNGEKVKDMAKPAIFDVQVSPRVLTQYVNYLRAALRSPIASTKDRGEVSGGGRKPWKQKGTGNARVGSTRSPLWVGGGVVFGPTPERNYRLRMNRQERQRAILGTIARIIDNNNLIVVDGFEFAEPSTKEAAENLLAVGAEGKIAVICPFSETNAWLSFRNIAGVKVMAPSKLDIIYLMSANKVVASTGAIEEIKGIFDRNEVNKVTAKEGSDE